MSRHHFIPLGCALLLAASAAGAQSMPNINAPIAAARRAAAATNANISAQTGQALPTRSGPAAAAQAVPTRSGPAVAAQAVPRSAAGARQGTLPTVLVAAPQVTREVFTYADAGRRDPFFSLILTEDLRPLLSDLKLVGVLYAPTGTRSVAIFRDVLTNAQYRVQTGMPLGRMRVAQIKPKGVIFTIDEFGLSRQDSLMLSDSLKARIR